VLFSNRRPPRRKNNVGGENNFPNHPRIAGKGIGPGSHRGQGRGGGPGSSPSRLGDSILPGATRSRSSVAGGGNPPLEPAFFFEGCKGAVASVQNRGGGRPCGFAGPGGQGFSGTRSIRAGHCSARVPTFSRAGLFPPSKQNKPNKVETRGTGAGPCAPAGPTLKGLFSRSQHYSPVGCVDWGQGQAPPRWLLLPAAPGRSGS